MEIFQLFVNLINNAIDAMESVSDEDRWIDFDLASSERVSLSLINGGPPIPLETQEKIMTPFFTTKPAGKGTGFGPSHLPENRRVTRS